jgi:Leucine-rich repeat (LRR) protein
MTQRTKYLLIFFFLSGLAPQGYTQNNEQWQLSVEEVEEYKAQSQSLISFFEGTLNFLGDPASTVQEKEIVIEESYAKIFVNDQVQVEDDLDENREVPINKNIQDYLKDVDFFFKSAVFTFTIQSVEPMVGENGIVFFKVTLNRFLQAVTINNDTISSNRLRYLEINLDPFKKDLRIASFYTTKINEQEELRQWWSALPTYWKDIFGRDAVVFDTLLMSNIERVSDDQVWIKYKKWVHRQGVFVVAGNDTLPQSEAAVRLQNRKPDTVITLNDYSSYYAVDSLEANIAVIDNRLKQIVRLKSLDLSLNLSIVNLEPLTQFTELEELNFSSTPVDDLSPLRNLSKLRSLYFSSSLVRNLSPLQYASKIKEIYFYDTEIEDLSTVSHFKNLEKLYCFNTGIRDLSPLSQLQNLTVLKASNTLVDDVTPLKNLVNLRILDLSKTLVSDISPLDKLINLQQLNMDETMISNLDPLRNMQSLNLLHFSNTKVTDLTPLEPLKGLSRVYSDKNDINPMQATNLMRNNPGLLVVFNSDELNQWWNNLPIYWRALLKEQSGIGGNPSTEDLHQITNISKLDLSGNIYLQHMEPVNRLANLQELSIHQTEITDLEPLRNLHNLQKIDLSQTRVSEIKALEGLFQLQELNISNTRVESLEGLNEMSNLRLIMADGSRVSNATVMEIKKTQPKVLVVYQSEKLKFWWNNLSPEWKKILQQGYPDQAVPDALQLQSIADRTSLIIENQLGITHLEPIMPLMMLDKLVLNGTAVSDLNPLKGLVRLKHLELPGNPITDLSPLSSLTELEVLNIESTPVSDLFPLSSLTKIRQLNVSGTQIRSLKPLATLNQLFEIALYNTRVRNLNPVDKLMSLRHLKCYNTRISKKSIEKLKAARPELNILYY